MINILFVCSGNVHRSAIAEALFRKMVADRETISVDSAAICGARTRLKPDPNIRKVVDEVGVDLNSHRSKLINQDLVEKATLIIAVAEKGKRMLLEQFPGIEHKIRLLNSFTPGLPRDIPSPAYKTYDLCLIMRANILAALPGLLAFLIIKDLSA